MAAIGSCFYARAPAPLQIDDAFLRALPDAELIRFFQKKSVEELWSTRFQPETLQRFLSLCSADQALILLTWLTRPKALADEKFALQYTLPALRVLDSPERLSVFVEALKKGREATFYRINDTGLCNRGRDEMDRNCLYQRLPLNIQHVLDIERQCCMRYYPHLPQIHYFRRSSDFCYRDLVVQSDSLLDNFVQWLLRRESLPLPPASLCPSDRKG